MLYEQFAVEAAGLPVVAGRLPRDAALPGAAASFTLEALVPGGLAVSVSREVSLISYPKFCVCVCGVCVCGGWGGGGGGGAE